MAPVIPDNPDALLTRAAVAEALTAAGYPVKEKTLATKASRGRGDGPPFRRFGPRIVLYQWSTALAWAESRTTISHQSASEADIRTAA